MRASRWRPASRPHIERYMIDSCSIYLLYGFIAGDGGIPPVANYDRGGGFPPTNTSDDGGDDGEAADATCAATPENAEHNAPRQPSCPILHYTFQQGLAYIYRPLVFILFGFELYIYASYIVSVG